VSLDERRPNPAVDPKAVVRVLVVDDSSLVRRIVTTTLKEEADFEVVGTARDGQHAIAQVKALEPDVVVLDVEMPILDGLATLPKLLEVRPHLPVVMYSTLTERGASATLEALARGAVDYATKPTMVSNQEEAAALIRRDLVTLVRTWGRIEHARRGRSGAAAVSAHPSPTSPAAAPPVVRRAAPAGQRVGAVVIGSSTGGPNALSEVVGGLPATLPVPVLVVQHMPEVFTRLLAERLDARCIPPVREVHQGDVVEAGTIYIAQGGAHFSVRREGVRVVADCTDDPPENFCRPAVDVLFRSAVEVWGSGLLGVMLTGMGSDGLEGSRGIVEAGGTILAQDEETSVVWGMPGAVAKAGLASDLLPLGEVARAIVERSMTPTMRVRA
jgi:two-component system chemotaxis response regulator CheB